MFPKVETRKNPATSLLCVPPPILTSPHSDSSPDQSFLLIILTLMFVPIFFYALLAELHPIPKQNVPHKFS